MFLRIYLLIGAFLFTTFPCPVEAANTPVEDDLASHFASPPPTARPWVYWTWLSSNVTKESITADLEAMQRVGIGGALILDVENGTPPGPMKFFDAQWQEMFKFTVAEAKRLGLEINMNDGPGYSGSGGSWVPPEKAMQWVFASQTAVTGGVAFQGTLPIPPNQGAYQDLAVFAVPATKTEFKIADFEMKALYWKTWVAYRGTQSAPLDATAPAEAIIPLTKVIDLTSKMQPDGTLIWDAPAGDWVILRMGYACNGSKVGPSPQGQNGLETDKLSLAATTLHFDTFVKHLSEITGPEMRSALVGTHIDSWEGGGQNWTANMREEFTKRRGYDPLPYLPIMTGRVLGDLQTTERFLWDLRQTVSELMVEKYLAPFQQMAHQQGLRFTFEGYTTTGNDLDAIRYADEPMAEFWTPNGQGADFYPTAKSMSSAAHLNDQAVVGAESFTSGKTERWLWHPAMFKEIGDDAFSQGINRFVFHRYAAQRFEARQPGLQMGPWGLHYERTNTWWEWTAPWHTYLTRCQYLLRQGKFVADVLALQSEEPLLRYQIAPIPGYDYDACGPDTVADVRVQDGRVTLPNGRNYRLLVLQNTGTMTVPLLKKIRNLVHDGAAILGNPPQRTPGLTDLPQADVELKKLATELWGDGSPVPERTVGAGRVFSGISPVEALAKLDIAPDFTADQPLRWIHRKTADLDFYFVSNQTPQPLATTASFRVTGRQPEFWNAETGAITRAAFFKIGPDHSDVRLNLGPKESVFVVFRKDTPPLDPVLTCTRDGLDTFTRPNATPPLWADYDPAGNLLLQLTENGHYELTLASGRKHAVDVVNLPASPETIDGPWQVRFADKEYPFDTLLSWSEHPDDTVKYFSGAATYTKTITLTPAQLAADHRLALDLGNVQIMARVKLNGHDLGILWRPPYRVEITPAAQSGPNTLEITVVNLWPNRLIGDEQLPEDSDRNKNGTLKSWPQWLLDNQPSPTGRTTFSSWRLWNKTDSLQPSGLLGPVTLHLSTVIKKSPYQTTP